MKGEKKQHTKNYNLLFVSLMFLATIIMGIGYASVNGILLTIDGTAKAVSLNSLHITDAVYDSSFGADLSSSTINDYIATTLNSTITLGNDTNSSITYAITIYNTTNDNYIFSGTSFSAPNFYDNQEITFHLTGLNVGDTILANTNKTFTITFQYVGNNTSNPTLNSYISFDFEKYYTITYQNINTTGQNYPTRVLQSETTKVITFTNDIPYDVDITPTVSYTYNNGVLTLSNVNTDITIDRYYSITYVTTGTQPPGQPVKYLHGSSVTFLTPTDGSNTFVGWYDNPSYTGNALTSTTGLTGNLTLYAKWILSGYQNATTYIISLTESAPSNTTNVITVTPPDNTCTNTFAYDGTTQNNLRYVGANPCNYVKFNCDTNNNCELWRIMGVMNDAGANPMLKIVKDDNTLTSSWNTQNDNVWDNASLQNNLNSTFLNSLNAGVATNYIESVQWPIGSVNTTDTSSSAYTSEQATTSSSHPIGIIRVSDFAFATSGTDNNSRATCLSTSVSNLAQTCTDNNYLFLKVNQTGQNQWTLNKASKGKNAMYITNVGRASSQNVRTSTYYYRPVLYLKSSTLINTSSGTGSSSNPYILSTNS